MSIKVNLNGKLTPEEALKIVKAHLEKATGKKICKIAGLTIYKDTDYPGGGYPAFNGVEFEFEPEELDGG